MRRDQRDRSGGLVHLAALDADGAVLDHVDPPDPVRACKTVRRAISSASASSSPSSDTGNAVLEADDDLDRQRRARRVGRERVRLVRRRVPRVLEHARLDRAAEEVLVDRVRRGLRLHDGDALGERVLDLLVARPDPVAQRSDHRDPRIVRLERELEAKLVVALAGAAVDDRLGAELERDLGDRLRDHRARERRDERVLALVERVRLDRARALVVRERVLAVDEDDVVGTCGLCRA